MPRTKAKPIPIQTAPSSSRNEEWEDWMDWDNRSEQDEKMDKHDDAEGNRTSQESAREISSSAASPPSSKKRKFSFEDEENDGQVKAPASSPKKQVQDRSHSVVEKRYRENLNQKIADLRDCIPTLRASSTPKEPKPGPAAALKQNKATILSEAMAYIRQLERRNKYLEKVQQELEDRAASDLGTGSAVHSVREATNEPRTSEESQEQGSEEQDSSSPEPPEGMIPVPAEMRRLWDEGRNSDHYADTIQDSDLGCSPSISSRGGRGLGRMVFGSLAGIMILDGLGAHPRRLQTRDDPGLAALPSHHVFPLTRQLWSLLKGVLSHPHLSSSPLVNAFILFCICGFALFLYLYYSKPLRQNRDDDDDDDNQSSTIRANKALSPMEIRQNAWLTSIQTVWVPRRHMLLEMLALTAETAAYLTRNLVGWKCYSWLTGRSEEQELARVRAWEIALDAQLSGGDRELSKTRLVLTLWASGTLPNTPARLMLKALHIRVLFWRPSRFEGVCRVMHRAAMGLSSRQWRQAATLQKQLDEEVEASRLGSCDDADTTIPTTDKDEQSLDQEDPLSDQVKALLSEKCEDLLDDATVKRAYELAWNIPTATASSPDDGELDGQVQGGVDDANDADSAMLGPLDKLALWHRKGKGRLSPPPPPQPAPSA